MINKDHCSRIPHVFPMEHLRLTKEVHILSWNLRSLILGSSFLSISSFAFLPSVGFCSNVFCWNNQSLVSFLKPSTSSITWSWNVITCTIATYINISPEFQHWSEGEEEVPHRWKILFPNKLLSWRDTSTLTNNFFCDLRWSAVEMGTSGVSALSPLPWVLIPEHTLWFLWCPDTALDACYKQPQTIDGCCYRVSELVYVVMITLQLCCTEKIMAWLGALHVYASPFFS